MTQRRVPFTIAFLAAGALAALGGAGCNREHLSSNYGQAYAAWFNSQHVNHPPASPEQANKTVESLDAQEAAVVSRGYRRGSNKGVDDNGQGGQMLMVGPSRGGGDVAYIPPPSVPQGQ